MEKLHDYLSFASDKGFLVLLDRDERLLFSDKLHKFNAGGWEQERNFVLTNKFVYNLKKKGIALSVPLPSLEAQNQLH